MLPKERRIPKADIQHILKGGTRRNSPHILLYMAKNKAGLESNSRFSFSAPKKVAKTAVLRNKLRRRGYSVISKHINKINKGNYYLFVYKKDSEKLDFTELEREIQDLVSN